MKAPRARLRVRATPGKSGSTLLAIAAGLGIGSFASSARADDSHGSRRAVAARERGIPYTMVEVSVGTLALPAAKICPTSPDACSRGEAGLGIGIRNLYQFGRFGVGAGVVWGTSLRNDTALGAADLERSHSRSYFLFEGWFRYMFAQSTRWEFWAAGNLGGVSVHDAWSVKNDRNPPAGVQFVGPRDSSIGSQGFAAGVGVGGAFLVIENLSVGGHLRYQNWILPFTPQVNPTNDQASLSGRLDVFDLSFALAYRLSL